MILRLVPMMVRFSTHVQSTDTTATARQIATFGTVQKQRMDSSISYSHTVK